MYKIRVELIDIDTTEELVLNRDYLPAELRGWRFYRIEYGGCNEQCVWEGRVLLPPGGDPEALVSLLMGMQVRDEVVVAL